MALPAERPLPTQEPPVADPGAVERAYHFHRARRRARVEHRQRARYASLRFWVVVWVLLVLCVVAALTIWAQIQQLFGL